MPWPWEREQKAEQARLMVGRLEEAVAQLDRRVIDLRAEVSRLRALREAQERGGGLPCPNG